MGEKRLDDLQIEILEKITKDSIKIISYRNPKKELGTIVKDKNRDEVSGVLRSLETDFSVLSFDPALRSGFFNKSGYRVDLEKARELYASYKEKEE